MGVLPVSNGIVATRQYPRKRESPPVYNMQDDSRYAQATRFPTLRSLSTR